MRKIYSWHSRRRVKTLQERSKDQGRILQVGIFNLNTQVTFLLIFKKKFQSFSAKTRSKRLVVVVVAKCIIFHDFNTIYVLETIL